MVARHDCNAILLGHKTTGLGAMQPHEERVLTEAAGPARTQDREIPGKRAEPCRARKISTRHSRRISLQSHRRDCMSNIAARRWELNRRHVLRGLGATVALPFLDCMRPMRAFAEVAQASPRRSVFIYLPNGVNTLDFQIREAGANYTFSKILSPLAKHRANITPISGLYHPHGLGHHHNCQKIWLTGGKVGATDRNTISMDQLMAQKTAEVTRYTSLELSSDGDTLAWTADGIRLPSERTPSVVFKRMFEAPAGGLNTQRRNLESGSPAC